MCINQMDELERNEQMSKMTRIYEQAEEVVAWLGPSYADSDMAFQYTQVMYQHERDVDWIVRKFTKQETKKAVVALGDLLDREYWQRFPFFQSILGLHYNSCIENNLVSNLEPLLAKVHSDGMDREKNFHESSNPNFDFDRRYLQDVDDSDVQHSENRIWDRQIFLGSSKIMGLGPMEVADGDVIRVPLGCPHSMIFRKLEDHYIVIGEAYIDGYIYEKAVEMWERGELQLETFELH